MIECRFRTEAGCSHVDKGVGLPIVVDESGCRFCVKEKPSEETRSTSYAVLNLIWGERHSRGLPVGPCPVYTPPPTMIVARREHPSRPNIADDMLAVARTVPRRTPAPVVADANDRLEICTDCDSWIDGRCKAACGTCKNRPRPLADKGRDCPVGKWRRG